MVFSCMWCCLFALAPICIYLLYNVILILTLTYGTPYEARSRNQIKSGGTLDMSIAVALFVIGASLSKPHTSELNGGFSIYIYIVQRTSFCKCKLTLLTQNVAHAEFKCGRNIEKNTWSISTLSYSSITGCSFQAKFHVRCIFISVL